MSSSTWRQVLTAFTQRSGIASKPEYAPAICPNTAPMESESPPRLTAAISPSSKLSVVLNAQSAASSVETAQPVGRALRARRQHPFAACR